MSGPLKKTAGRRAHRSRAARSALFQYSLDVSQETDIGQAAHFADDPTIRCDVGTISGPEDQSVDGDGHIMCVEHDLDVIRIIDVTGQMGIDLCVWVLPAVNGESLPVSKDVAASKTVAGECLPGQNQGLQDPVRVLLGGGTDDGRDSQARVLVEDGVNRSIPSEFGDDTAKLPPHRTRDGGTPASAIDPETLAPHRAAGVIRLRIVEDRRRRQTPRIRDREVISDENTAVVEIWQPISSPVSACVRPGNG